MGVRFPPAGPFIPFVVQSFFIGAIMRNQELERQLANKARFWTGQSEVDHDALNQIRNIAALPILAGPIAVMPDVHMGIGATVGSVIPTSKAIIPSAVGVDIGCGMQAVRLNLKAGDLPESLKLVRAQIERDIPVGFAYHGSPVRMNRYGLEGMQLQRRYDRLMASFSGLSIMRKIKQFDEKRMTQQCGTLGGGNHFVEVCLDESGDVWLMLHSGSRNVGKAVGEAAMEVAKNYLATLDVSLRDRDLAWLAEGTPEFEEYISALTWAQDYARLNRDVMCMLALSAISKSLGRGIAVTSEAINCHHNYAEKYQLGSESVWLTRKGAVSAREGQMGIIPGSMGTRSYIVCGKGHEAAYCSCSHGAGRRMSRSKAKDYFSTADLAEQTAGVECRKDEGVVDEIPGAYKDIDEVMANQSDLVEVRHVLKQVLCVKG